MEHTMTFTHDELKVLRDALRRQSDYLGAQTDRAYRYNYKSLPLKEAREDFCDALLDKITDEYRKETI